MDTFGKRLKKLRTNLGLTQKDIADKLGISDVAYGYYEKDEREPNKYNLVKLAELFGVTVDFLLCKSEKKIDTSTVQHAFYSKYGTLPKEAQEDVDNYIEYLESKLKKK